MSHTHGNLFGSLLIWFFFYLVTIKTKPEIVSMFTVPFVLLRPRLNQL